MTILDVPFVTNPDERCVPATIGMVLGYFLPEKTYTMTELEKFCAYSPGRAAWPIQYLLNLDELGFELRNIGDFDLKAFAVDPENYLRQILKGDPAALEYQISKGDLPREAKRTQEYLGRGLPYDQRAGTRKDVEQLFREGWLVQLGVNANVIAGKPGYDGHSVLVVGLDGDEVIIHNPDGANGNHPNQHLPWKKLEDAWREYGGTFQLWAFRH